MTRRDTPVDSAPSIEFCPSWDTRRRSHSALRVSAVDRHLTASSGSLSSSSSQPSTTSRVQSALLSIELATSSRVCCETQRIHMRTSRESQSWELEQESWYKKDVLSTIKMTTKDVLWSGTNLKGRNPDAVGQVRFVGLQQSDVGEQLVFAAVPLVSFFGQDVETKRKRRRRVKF